eukprot:1437916-Rhodomonas_salina.2
MTIDAVSGAGGEGVFAARELSAVARHPAARRQDRSRAPQVPVLIMLQHQHKASLSSVRPRLRTGRTPRVPVTEVLLAVLVLGLMSWLDR